MRINSLFPLVFVIVTNMPLICGINTESGYAIVKRMFKKTLTINSLTYTITKQERIGGTLVKQISFTKMEKEPFKVYLKQQYPKEGMEVLYVQGTNNNKALINPNGFPWVNLKLNPVEGIMRNNQHHTIFQSGFDHVISILEFLCNKYQSEVENMVINNGTIIWDNKECYSIAFINPYFRYIDYTVSQDETIEDIAKKYKLSAHMILENNPDIGDYEDVTTNQRIKIPNDYSPKMLLYIDKKELVPVKMDIYDNNGLYEQYHYSQITVNPVLSSEEFSKDYKNYDF